MTSVVQYINIHELFVYYNEAFFCGKLGGCLVEWSDKMTLCAGLCYMDRNVFGMKSCIIRLSKPLLMARSETDLLETLLHEMIHAYLFLTSQKHENNELGRDGHGPPFLQKMDEINSITGLKLSVYHTFRDECDDCRQHVWLCDGPCRFKAPYHGLITRSRNLPPNLQTDFWFKTHQK
jgi:hypothetical protein